MSKETKNCIECDKVLDKENIKRQYGEESAVYLLDFCTPQCFTKRTERAHHYATLKYSRVIGMKGKNGFLDIEIDAHFAYVEPKDKKKLAIIRRVTKDPDTGISYAHGFYAEFKQRDPEKDQPEGVFKGDNFMIDYADLEGEVFTDWIGTDVRKAFHMICPVDPKYKEKLLS